MAKRIRSVLLIGFAVVLVGCQDDSVQRSHDAPFSRERPSSNEANPEVVVTDSQFDPDRPMQLSSQLSSRAKREMLLNPPDHLVTVSVTIGSGQDRSVALEIEKVGGKVMSRSDTTRLMNVTIPAGKLAELAQFDGVVYVEAGGNFGAK